MVWSLEFLNISGQYTSWSLPELLLQNLRSLCRFHNLTEQSDVDVGCWGCSMIYDAVREEISRTYNFMEFCTVLILFLDATLFKGN